MTTRSRGRCAGRGRRAGRGCTDSGRSLSDDLNAVARSSLAAASSSSSCSSSWSSLAPRPAEAPNRSCRSLAMSSLRCATMASNPLARASTSWRAARSARRAARSASSSFGIGSAASVTLQVEHDAHAACIPYPAISGRQMRCGCCSATGLSRSRQARPARSKTCRFRMIAEPTAKVRQSQIWMLFDTHADQSRPRHAFPSCSRKPDPQSTFVS